MSPRSDEPSGAKASTAHNDARNITARELRRRRPARPQRSGSAHSHARGRQHRSRREPQSRAVGFGRGDEEAEGLSRKRRAVDARRASAHGLATCAARRGARSIACISRRARGVATAPGRPAGMRATAKGSFQSSRPEVREPVVDPLLSVKTQQSGHSHRVVIVRFVRENLPQHR